MKAGFVGLIGRPSSGKSTFLNQVCGYKVSIISTVPQTTRNRIRGILNSDQGQLVFIDTPGFHLSNKKFNLHLKELVMKTLEEVDIILYIVDCTRPPGTEERMLMELLARHKENTVIAFNKMDLLKNDLEQIQTELKNVFQDPEINRISALNGEGIPDLVDKIFKLAPEGERLYPEDLYTDQPPEFRISEIIREKAILNTRNEVPHSLYVEISDLEMIKKTLLWVRGFIYTERESQKGILVGKHGDKIKCIVREAEEELNTLFPYRIQLDLRVKVKPKWRRNENLIKKLLSGM